MVTDAYGAGGGIAQYNRDLFGALAGSGQVEEVVVLPRHGQASAQDLPVGVSQLQARPGKLGFALRALWTLQREGPFDLIFCGHLFMAPLAALLSKVSGRPLWLQLHGIEAWQSPGLWKRRAAERTWLVTAVSRHTRRRFLAWADCAPEFVRVLPNTVDERFTPGPKSSALLDRYDLHDNKVLLTVSRLAASERYKGHDRVIRAVAALRTSHPEIVYAVAGDGDDRPRLEQLARELDVVEQVRFLGYVPEEDLPDLYRTADLFVMPSTGEGFGIVFLQAQASGIPVIGGDSDGSLDPLRDGVDGQLVPAADITAIAKTIRRVLEPGGEVKDYKNMFSMWPFQRCVAQLMELVVHAGRVVPTNR